MNLIELTNLIRKTLPEWHVTLDEAEMVNITADQLNTYEGFAYIEPYAEVAPKCIIPLAFGHCNP